MTGPIEVASTIAVAIAIIIAIIIVPMPREKPPEIAQIPPVEAPSPAPETLAPVSAHDAVPEQSQLKQISDIEQRVKAIQQKVGKLEAKATKGRD